MRDSARPGAIQIGVLLLLAGMSAQAPALAEKTTVQSHDESQASHEASQYHRNHFKGLAGWSHTDSENSVTFGMEYTRLLSRRLGISVIIENTEGQFKSDTSGIVLMGFPTRRLFLFAGPAIERTLFEEHEYLMRTGLGYNFEPKGLLVSPLAWVDFIDGQKIYFVGVGVGKGF